MVGRRFHRILHEQDSPHTDLRRFVHQYFTRDFGREFNPQATRRWGREFQRQLAPRQRRHGKRQTIGIGGIVADFFFGSYGSRWM